MNMLTATCVGTTANGSQIWEYSQIDGAYWVREYCRTQSGSRSLIVKSPSGKLYRFSDYTGDELALFGLIRLGRVEDQQHACDLESIYDEL